MLVKFGIDIFDSFEIMRFYLSDYIQFLFKKIFEFNKKRDYF